MKIGIIGAGFSGLSSAHYLSNYSSLDVVVIESIGQPGGLAMGFNSPGWAWSLEQHYHHFFASDNSVLDLAERVGQGITFNRPITSTYIEGKTFQLDSPRKLLFFDRLPIVDRLRMGVVLAYLKVTPFWKPLEFLSAERFLTRTMGVQSWNVLWKPLFIKKFSHYHNKINAAWFWARIKKRSARLGYPQGGFLEYAKKIQKVTEERGVKYLFNQNVREIVRENDNIFITTNKNKYMFDQIICTLPTAIYLKITRNLPRDYINKYKGSQSVGAINMVLSLKKSFLNNGTYWLSVNDVSMPFVAVVEHTNFIERKYYNNEHLVYIGNYLIHEHKYYKYSDKELLNEFLPHLKKISPQFDVKDINRMHVFKSNFAQPIILENYSEKIPPFKTPIDGIYLCNMQQVYPWDRGTNYAVELGEKVARMLVADVKIK